MPMHRWMPKLRERREAWAFVLVSVLAPTLLCATLGPYALWQSRIRHEQSAELNSQNLTSAIKRSASADVEKIDTMLRAVVAELEAQPATGALDMRLAQRRIDHQAALRPELDGLLVTDPTGVDITAPAITGRRPIDFSDGGWFRVQRNRPDAGLIIGPVLTHETRGERMLSFSRRYRQPDGAFGGVVIATVRPSNLAKGLVGVDLGAYGIGPGSGEEMSAWRAQAQMVIVLCISVVTACIAGTWLLLRAMGLNRAAHLRTELLAKIFEYSGEAIAIMDRKNRIVEVNPAFVRRTGYQQEEALGLAGSGMMSPSMTTEQFAAIDAGLRSEGTWRGELIERAKDGREFPVWMVFTTVRDATGHVSHVMANSIGLSELKRAEAQIHHLAHHDALTRLPNRVLFQARLEQAMASARREGTELAMLFIDMDRFKTINDTLGHPVGDGLLVEVGARLLAIVRQSDIVARLGGDEFVIVLTGVADGGASAASIVASKLINELGRPYQVAGHELHSTPSIGIGIFPSDGNDANALMKCADTAMYQAKAAGRNNFQFFTCEMKQASAERLTIENGLRNAAGRGELLLHYQPQVDFSSGRVVGLEALVRWRHPELGLIPPLKFIPIAEETGQIEAIGLWVLEEALAQIAVWRTRLDPRLRVAVNVSALQLRTDGFVAAVAAALRRHALKGDALELEVTESTALRDPVRTALRLRDLRALGLALALDDFGTGYSSMMHLKQLPLNRLKLDRSFVMDIERDASDVAICKATIQLANSLGLEVVAEGVETQAQHDLLRSLGCDIAQGYLIARPMPADECEVFLRRALPDDQVALLA
ncbi:MAG: EAL domain-containing protein [Burkholderiales bacterium]